MHTFFRPARPLTTVEIARPLLALDGGRAEVDEVLITVDYRYQTNILAAAGMWFFTFDHQRDGLRVIHAQSPDYRRVRSILLLADIIPDEAKRAAAAAALREAWRLGAEWQALHHAQYSARSL